MKYPLKLVEWHDAYNGDHEWIKEADLGNTERPLLISTIGFEVRRNENCVTLAMSMTDNGRLCDLFTIPLAVIIREQTFRRRG